MCKVSVIIPVYNQESFIHRCLDSIISQTETDLEIICVDDGSSDNSLNILKQYEEKDNRIKILSQENKGLSEARNNALMIATGDYIGFVDSDDWIDENYYETLLNLAYKENADIAVAQITESPNNCFLDKKGGNFSSSCFYENLSQLETGSVCDKIFKRELFTKNNILFPKGAFYEDNIVVLTLLFHSKKSVWTTRTSYYYYVNMNGICRSKVHRKKKDNDRLYIAKLMLNFANEHQFSQIEKDELRRFILRTIGRDIIRNKKMRKIIGKRFAKKYLYSLFSKLNFFLFGIPIFTTLKLPILYKLERKEK